MVRRLRWPLAGLAALAVVLACVLVIPQWLVRWELGAAARALTATDKARALNDVRTTLLQGIGGAVILLGAYFTYRQLQTSREQLQIAQQGQVTERFTRAVDQLGSPEVDVRIGGIYTLDGIARDSTTDRRAVVEVLAAFVRNHAPWPPRTPLDDSAAGDASGTVTELRKRMPDVYTAMTILGRAQWRDRSVELQLNNTDLRRAFLREADLQHTYMPDVHLENAILPQAVLRKSTLWNAHMQRVHLRNADLQGADLRGAQLQGANLAGAQLQDADLRSTNLRGVTFKDEHGRERPADFLGAQADRQTGWPDEFDPKTAGVQLVDDAATEESDRERS